MAEIVGRIKGDIRGINASLKTLKAEFRDLQRVGSKAFGSLDRNYKKVTVSAGKANVAIKKTSAGVVSLGRNVTITSKKTSLWTTRFQRQLVGVSRGIGGLGRSVGALGASFGILGGGFLAGAVIGEVGRLTIELERASAEVATLVDTATVPLPKLISQVRELGTALGFDQVDSVKALYDAISAGFVEPSNALAVVAQSAKLAKAGLTDMATATDAITTVLNSFGLEASEAERVSDVLFKTVEKGKIRLPELAKGIGTVTPVANLAGINLEEVAGAVASLTNAGIKAPRALTGLRTIITSIVKPARQSAGAAKQLGFDFSVAAVRAKGFVPFITELREKLKAFEEAGGDSANVLGRLLGRQRALLAGSVLAGEGFDKLKESVVAANNALGATEKAAEKISKTFGARLGRATARLKKDLVDVGTATFDLLSTLTEGEGPGSGFFQALAQNAKSLAISIPSIAAGLVKISNNDFKGASESFGVFRKTLNEANVAVIKFSDPKRFKDLERSAKRAGQTIEEFLNDTQNRSRSDFTDFSSFFGLDKLERNLSLDAKRIEELRAGQQKLEKAGLKTAASFKKQRTAIISSVPGFDLVDRLVSNLTGGYVDLEDQQLKVEDAGKKALDSLKTFAKFQVGLPVFEKQEDSAKNVEKVVDNTLNGLIKVQREFERINNIAPAKLFLDPIILDANGNEVNVGEFKVGNLLKSPKPFELPVKIGKVDLGSVAGERQKVLAAVGLSEANIRDQISKVLAQSGGELALGDSISKLFDTLGNELKNLQGQTEEAGLQATRAKVNTLISAVNLALQTVPPTVVSALEVQIDTLNKNLEEGGKKLGKTLQVAGANNPLAKALSQSGKLIVTVDASKLEDARKDIKSSFDNFEEVPKGFELAFAKIQVGQRAITKDLSFAAGELKNTEIKIDPRTGEEFKLFFFEGGELVKQKTSEGAELLKKAGISVKGSIKEGVAGVPKSFGSLNALLADIGTKLGKDKDFQRKFQTDVVSKQVNDTFNELNDTIENRIQLLREEARSAADPAAIRQAIDLVSQLRENQRGSRVDFLRSGGETLEFQKAVLEGFKRSLKDVQKVDLEDFREGINGFERSAIDARKALEDLGLDPDIAKLFEKGTKNAKPPTKEIEELFKKGMDFSTLDIDSSELGNIDKDALFAQLRKGVVGQAASIGKGFGNTFARETVVGVNENLDLVRTTSRGFVETFFRESKFAYNNRKGEFKSATDEALDGVTEGINEKGAEFTTAFNKAFGVSDKNPQISDVIGTINFGSEQAGRQALEASNRALRQSAGFSAAANIGFGNPIGFQRGGEVPGVGRGDKVPALLEPKERVLTREENRQFGPLLESLRNQISASAGPASQQGSVQIGSVTIQVEGQTSDDILQDLMSKLVRLQELNQLEAFSG